MANSQTFTLTFDAKLNVDQMRSSINNIQGALNKLNLPTNLSKGFSDTFTKLENEIRNFESLAGKDITSKADFGKLEKSTNNILNLFNKLKSDIMGLGGLSSSQIQKLFPDSIKNNIKDATKALDEYISKTKNAENAYAKTQKEIQKYQDAISKEQSKNVVSPDTFKQFKQAADEASAEVGKISEKIAELTEQAAAKAAQLTKPMSSSTYRDMLKDLEAQKKALEEAKIKAEETRNAVKGITTEAIQAKNIESLNQKLVDASQKAAQLKQELNNIQSQGLTDLVSKIGQLTGLDMSQFVNDTQTAEETIKGLTQALETYLNNTTQKFVNESSNVISAVNAEKEAFGSLENNIKDTGNAFEQFNHQAQEIEQIKSRIQYFFGLNNAINLLKRTVQSAIETVKELDATMTETAVVTDFSVSDMWGQLPEYTKRANELGVSTQQAYEAATLYYQQGLNTNEVNALSVETLKMARIAGLDAAEATDRMTNALRGFNMALDETNARRVNDVYSELAARTASDVDEISTAMTKVASLANSANMEFETTSAFLTQIIETTREAPETAGTALKTIIARFTEVKKLFDEGELKGTDEEGVGIDLNKISSALRIAGIDLNKYFLGEMGLDDVFMELASKWDGLTNIQQRYIATQAAGSRQQSRFIAMMQDYARTQELVSYAYNANGASAKQFEKTQESLQSKLAKLKNAWNEFTMSIANSNLIKGAVDALTLLLNVINKITNGFGAFENGAGAAVNAILKIGMAAAGLKIGGLLLGTGAGVLGGITSGNPITLKDAFINSAYSALGNKAVTLGANGTASTLNQSIGKTLGMAAMGPFGWLAPFGEKIKQFKQNSAIDELRASLLDKYAQTENQKDFDSLIRALDASDNTPTSLFGAIGNQFITKTKLGGNLSKGFGSILGKIGLGSGAALSGAATLAATLGTVAVAAGTAYAAIKLIYDATPAGQLKSAQKLADTMQEVASSASKAAEATKTAQETYSSKTSDVSNAKTISERNAAIQNRNDYITSLLQQDKTYAEYLKSTFENGQLVLTLDENALAAAATQAAKGATDAALASGLSEAGVLGKQAKIYENQLKGINLEALTITEGTDLNNLSERKLTEKESQRYFNIGNELNKTRIAMQAQAAQAYSQYISSTFKDLDDEIADSISTALGNAYDADKFEKEVKKQRLQYNPYVVSIEEQYKQLYGYAPEEGMKDKDIITAIKTKLVTDQQQNNVTELMNLVQGNTRYKNILDAYNGIFDNFNLKNISSLEDVYQQLFNFSLDDNNIQDSAESISAILNTLGISFEDFNERITENINLQKKQSAKAISGITYSIFDIYKLWEQPNNANKAAQFVSQIYSLDNLADQQLVNNLLNQFQSSEIGLQIADIISNGIKDGKLDQEFSDWINQLNFDDPINSYAALQQAINSTNSYIKDTANAILTNENELSKFSASAQVSYFLLSESFESLEEDLGNFINENGEISSSKINELAKSNEKLNKLLKNNVITAKALATAITGIEKGTINVTNLNQAVLAALNSMDDLDGAVQTIIEDLNGFDPGYNENDIAGFINKAYETSLENFNKGAYGNNQMANYMQKIFGSFNYNEATMGDYGEAYKNWLSNNISWLEANKDNMFSAWSDFASTLDNSMLGTAKIYEQDGEIIIEAGEMTTEQLISAMAATGKVTRAQAEMMIGDYKNYSADFAYEMANNDFPTAIQKWYDALPEINGKKIYDQTDLETLRVLFNKSSDEIDAAIGQIVKGAGQLQSIKWTDDEGNRTADSISKALGEVGISTINTEGLIDYDSIKQGYLDLKLPELFNSDFQTILGDNKTFTANLFGNQTPIAIQEGETAAEAYARAYQEALADLNAEAFVEALSKVDINITSNAEEANKSITTLLDTAIALNDTFQSTFTADISQASSQITELMNEIAALNAAKTAAGIGKARHGKTGSTPISSLPGFATGKEGSVKRNYEGMAITGEEGTEARITKDGQVELLGTEGPQLTYVNKDDTILTHTETKKWFGQNSKYLPGFARGYGDVDDKSGKGGGGSGSGADEDIEEIKNELDWLYNLVQDIKELEKQEELLQEQYEFLLKDQNATGHDLYNVMVQQMGNLASQLAAQQLMLEKRQQEMREFMEQTNDVGGYARWNEERNEVEIDWEKIDKDIADGIIDKDQYDHIVDIIDELETIEDQEDDAEKAILETKSKIQEFQNIWRDTYIDFEKRVYDAIVKTQQKIIDGYSELNDTLNNSNQAILDSLQKEIDLQRQIRDNTKTEEEIAESEAQLAYLRRDTTGGNDVAIKQLEEQLNEQRQSYEDNLIDQAINRIGEDNDKAAEQREHQIEIMQAQLDYASENGLYWEQVNELLSGAFDDDGAPKANSQLIELLNEVETNGMSETGRQAWIDELFNTLKEVDAYTELIEAIKNNDFVAAFTGAMTPLTDLLSDYSQSMLERFGGGSNSGGSSDGNGGGSSDGNGGEGSYSGSNYNPIDNQGLTTEQVIQLQLELGVNVDGLIGNETRQAMKDKDIVIEKVRGGSVILKGDSRYATGGLNTVTGPAWLDGTPSKPEYVLNADQTQAFLKLADVLPSIMSGSTQTSTSANTIYLNLTMNVDEIGSDYDVDRIADRVKDIIYDTSTYRTVNTLNFSR